MIIDINTRLTHFYIYYTTLYMPPLTNDENIDRFYRFIDIYFEKKYR